MKSSENGTATLNKKANKNNGAKNSAHSANKPNTQSTVAVKVSEKSPEQIAKERLERLHTLKALQADIEQLEKTKQDFNSIRTYSEIEVVIVCNGQTAFRTGRTDTVEAAIACIDTSISEKRKKAYQELAAFEF